MISTEIKRTFAILKPRFRRGFANLTAISVLTAVAESVGLSLIFVYIQMIAEPAAFADRPLIGEILKHPALPEPPLLYVAFGAAIGLFYILKNAFLAYALSARLRYLNEVNVWIATGLFTHYLGAPYEKMATRNSSELVQNVQSLAYEIAGSVLEPLASIIAEGLTIAALVCVLLIAEPTVTVAMAVSLGCLTFVLYVAFRRRFARWGKATVDLNRTTVQAVQEAFSSLKEIQVLGRQAYFDDRFAAVARDLARVRRVTQLTNALPRFGTEAMMVTAMVLLIGFVVASGRPVESAVATLGLYAAAGFRLVPSLNRILMHLNYLKAARAIVDRICSDIEAAELDRVPTEARTPGDNRRPEIRDIAFEDVSYRYPTGSAAAIERISLTIRRGDSIGIVGASGAGKSTLADVLLGLLHPTEGRILVNGAPAPSALFRSGGVVGYVAQSVALIDSTVRRNIAFGIPDDEIDEAALRKSVELAALGDFVATLPMGLDTVVGERGARLSGGQRQRIGIARALYCNPQFLVFDEATSALDSETESSVTEAMERLSGRVTLLAIAHRLSTVRRCDKIAFMKAGRLVDIGPFDDLVARNPDFARMVRFAELTGRRVDEAAP